MNYFYEAVDQTGKSVVGKIEAESELEAQQRLTQSGFRPHSIVANITAPSALPPPPANLMPLPQNSGAAALRAGPQAIVQNPAPPRSGPPKITMAGNAARVAARTGARRSQPSASPSAPSAPAAQVSGSALGGVSTRDLMYFFQQFASLTHSGMTLYAALDNLAPRTPNKNLSLVARKMAEQARNGGRISDVMEAYPRIFPGHITGMVRAGELGGFVEIVLAEIALTFEQNIALYKGAWIPKALATQGLFVVALTQPLAIAFFGADLNIGRMIQLYFQMAILRNIPIAIGVYLLIRFFSKRLQLPQHRYLRDSWSLKLPPFGQLQRQAAISNFIRMLRRLYHAGISPSAAWDGATQTASNVVIRDQFAAANDMMQRGASLPEAFTATGLFDNTIENVIITGNQSGQVVESLDQAADFYNVQVEDALKKSRFMMLRYGILAMLILGGGALCWLTHSWYSGMFDWVGRNFSAD